MSERPTPEMDFALDAERLNASIDAGDRERERRVLGEFRLAQRKLDELMGDNGPARASERRLRLFQDELAGLRLGGRPAIVGVAEDVATALRTWGRLSAEVVQQVRGALGGEKSPTPEQARAVLDRLTQVETGASRYAEAANNQLATGVRRFAEALRAASPRADVDRLTHEAMTIARESGFIQQLAGQARIQWAKALVIQRDTAPKP